MSISDVMNRYDLPLPVFASEKWALDRLCELIEACEDAINAYYVGEGKDYGLEANMLEILEDALEKIK